MPEADSTLTKVDFGTMQLAVQPTPTSTPVPFAQIPYNDAADAVAYDAAAYVAGAGVVDIPASQLLIQPLTVTDLQAQVVATLPDPSNPSDRIVVLRERELTAETDDRGVYLDECGAPWSPKDPTVEVQVRFRGGPPPAGTRLRIAQYSPDFPGFGEMNWALVSSTAGDGAQQPFVEMTVQGGSVVDGAYAIVAVPPAQPGSRSAVVNLALTALRPGPPILQFSALAASDEAGAPLAMVPFPQNLDDGFANARVLPFHNAMADAYQNWLLTGPGVDLATQRLFDSVFRTFFLMYPAMRFLRDPLQFQAWRARIVAATDPAIFETAAYMPVTRPLSAGQRQMLLDWSHYVDGTVPTPPRGATHARRG